MAKNPRRTQKENAAVVGGNKTKTPSLVSSRGKKVIMAGVIVVLSGFWILTFTDPAGQNWASTLSPALLILGYAAIGVGIVLPDRVSTSAPENLPPA